MKDLNPQNGSKYLQYRYITSDKGYVSSIYKELFSDKTAQLKDGKNKNQTLHKG